MTAELKHQTEVIAIYDGYIKKSMYNDAAKTKPIDMYVKYKNGFMTENKQLTAMPYHTNDTWLMPVARKVFKELTDTELQISIEKEKIRYGTEVWKGLYNSWAKIHNAISNMQLAFSQTISELFTSVYNGILFLNELKNKQ